jgi:uncharacterized protein
VNIFVQIINNKYIIIPLFAWFIAQSIKVIYIIITMKKLDLTRFVGSGGMPSSHSAFVVAMSAMIGGHYGVDTPLFALSAAFSLVVMYDACGVRRAAGKQAEALNKLIHHINDPKQFNEDLKELIGHTPFQVIMGAVLGIVVACVFLIKW